MNNETETVDDVLRKHSCGNCPGDFREMTFEECYEAGFKAGEAVLQWAKEARKEGLI